MTSKAERARELLRAGWSVADTAREVGAHYSQVHGIHRKMQETAPAEKKEALKAGMKGRKPAARRAPRKAEPEPTDEPTEWGRRDTDIEAGQCANCGYDIIERQVSYGDREYGGALIHVGVRDDAEAIAIIQRCTATREGDEAPEQAPDWEDGDE